METVIPFQTPYNHLQLIEWKLSTKKVVERKAKKQQQQMNQLTDMILALRSLLSFHSQQQQVPNSSAHNIPHSSGVGQGAIANAVDNTPLNGAAPGNKMEMAGLYGGNIPPKRVAPNRMSGRTGHKYISQWCWVMR